MKYMVIVTGSALVMGLSRHEEEGQDGLGDGRGKVAGVGVTRREGWLLL